MNSLRWGLLSVIAGFGLGISPGRTEPNPLEPTLAASPELKREVEFSGDPPEAQKIEAESQQLQLHLQGQPTPAVGLGAPLLNDPTLRQLEWGS